jgi:hypothetical protein
VSDRQTKFRTRRSLKIPQNITGQAYRAVVFASLESRIKIYEADHAAHKLDDDVEALYKGSSETMIIRPHLKVHRVANRRTIVHEATHAIQDAQLANAWVWNLDREATAYIAEWLFVIHSSPNAGHLTNNPNPHEPIDIIALKIARAFAGKNGAVPDAADSFGGCDLRQSDLFGHDVATSLGPPRRRPEAPFPLEPADAGPNRSGPSRNWLKTKNRSLFERDPNNPNAPRWDRRARAACSSSTP